MSDIIRTAEDIEAADKLELRASDPESGEPRRFDSVVQDVTEEGIVVSMPVEGRVSVPLPEGAPVFVSIWKEYADHRFKSRVLGRQPGRIPCLILAKPLPDAITRQPRRAHYRVTTRIPAAACVTDPETEGRFEAIVADLSARGCRLQTSNPVPRDACVSLDFDLPFPPDQEGHDRTKPLRRINGQVKWTLDPGVAARSGKRPYVHGIEFLELDT